MRMNISKMVESRTNPSRVIAIPPEEPKVAEHHFHSKLAFETDPSDVYMDLQNNSAEIIVIDAGPKKRTLKNTYLEQPIFLGARSTYHQRRLCRGTKS